MIRIAAAAAFVSLVVASNWLTAEYGQVAEFVTAGTFTAGLVLAARDAVRETAGKRWVYACIAAGVVLSAVMTYAAGTFPGGPAPLQLAVASGVAFGLSELLDHFVYEPLRLRGKKRALWWSNNAGAVLDSWLFLALAGFAVWPAAMWQVGVKSLMTGITLGFVALVGVVRVSVLRDRVRPEGA